MAKATDRAKKKVIAAESDAFTAVLGITFLFLAGTALFVCMRSIELYGKLF